MISIKGLRKVYTSDNKKLTAVDDLTLDIENGEIFGVIGYSGAGKSTFVRLLNRLEEPTEGNVIIDKQEITSLTKNELRSARKEIGMIFQHFNLLWSRTVEDNISFPLEIAGVSKEKRVKIVQELIDLVGLSGREKAYPSQLSGGQKQRVGIARALANNPKVLLCDEATSALDPKTTSSILSLLQEINKKLGITIIVVTHQMEVIKQICTRTAIMDAGKVLEIGDTEEIFLNSPVALRKILGEDNIVLPDGVNLKLLFTNDRSNEAIITGMSRELNIDVSIIFGKLEKFRDNILGSLIINIPEASVEQVKEYLIKCDMRWQEVDNEL